MRKTLLIAAAALAGSVISSQAQVYSQNIVGYINVPLVNGFSVVANQLDYDGTGTNNTVATVFGTNLIAPSTVYAWDPSSSTYNKAQWQAKNGVTKWGGATNSISAALNAGFGVFVQSPATNNLTLVGTVLQGTNLISLVPGFNFVSSVAPISGGVTTNLGYVPNLNDYLYTWVPSTQNWFPYHYVTKNGVNHWNPSEPQITVGQPFFIDAATTAETWTNVFISN
jgi:hypothetical protein